MDESVPLLGSQPKTQRTQDSSGTDDSPEDRTTLELSQRQEAVMTTATSPQTSQGRQANPPSSLQRRLRSDAQRRAQPKPHEQDKGPPAIRQP